jgi:hypothetical protein
VIEYLAVDGDTPWTDWHEEILTPGWEWIALADVDALDGLDLPMIVGISGELAGLTFDMTPTTLDFFFDPIQPGTDIGIAKALQYVGTAPTSDPIVLREYPTGIPEPPTIVLMSLGLAGLGFARRKVKA